jgi:hypothetical protein
VSCWFILVLTLLFRILRTAEGQPVSLVLRRTRTLCRMSPRARNLAYVLAP